MTETVDPITKLDQTCLACPSQSDAWTTTGGYLYIRYRWGTLTVDLNRQNIFTKHVGDSMGGVMGEEEMLRHTGLRLAPNAERVSSWWR